MSEAVIRAEGLVKRYGGVTAVAGVDLDVSEGVVFALMGRNGAGKSSLIRMLLGLEPITAGRGTVLGFDSTRESVPLRARVGYVPETHHMYRWMTVAEIARFASAFYPTWDDAFCADLLRRFGLDPARRIRELSRGGVAKTALTLALAGSLAQQRRRPVTAGTMPTHTPLFAVLLTGIVIVLAALTFFPALALGPIAEALS